MIDMKESGTPLLMVGVDMAKANFVAAFDPRRSAKFANDETGFALFLQELTALNGGCCCVVMESTGVYHLRLARFLLARQMKVVVCNPQRINNYRKTFSPSVKHDRRDAHVLQDYGTRNSERLVGWNPPSFEVEALQQRQSTLEALKEDRLRINNRLHALAYYPQPDSKSLASLQAIESEMASQIAQLENDLDKDTKTLFAPQLQLLESIPGIGPGISRFMAVLTNGFQGFKSAKQLVSFLGLAPKVHESGQYRGRNSVSKMGSSTARKLVYMGALTAARLNIDCKNLYERLKQKGNPGRKARVAVMGKMVRQMFGVIKNNEPYQIKFAQKLAT